MSLGALSECLGADPAGLVLDAPVGAGVVDMCFFLEGHCVDNEHKQSSII